MELIVDTYEVIVFDGKMGRYMLCYKDRPNTIFEVK
jgi:hypothetical protein